MLYFIEPRQALISYRAYHMLYFIELRQALIPYRAYHMLYFIEPRQALISYRDCHMLYFIELRQALISYQDYHMLLLTLAGPFATLMAAGADSCFVRMMSEHGHSAQDGGAADGDGGTAGRGPGSRAQGRGAVALVFVIPTLVCVGCAMFGGVISLLEGCSFDDGFRFVISTVCGLGNPLTTWSPSTAHASAVNVVLGVAAQGLIGVIIGIAGGITPIVDAVERFDIAFGDTDAVEAISPDETADAGADKERGLDRAPPTGVLSP